MMKTRMMEQQAGAAMSRGVAAEYGEDASEETLGTAPLPSFQEDAPEEASLERGLPEESSVAGEDAASADASPMGDMVASHAGVEESEHTEAANAPLPPDEGHAAPGVPGGDPLAAVAEDEKREQYWNRVLTGDPETVPTDIRQRAGADQLEEPEEVRDYGLMGTINRSWAVDHLGVDKEEVQAHWGRLRADLAQKLGVEDDEREVFTALSHEQQSRPLRELGRQAYTQAYMQALLGEAPKGLSLEDQPDEVVQGVQHIEAKAARDGESCRNRLLPLSQRLASGMEVFLAAESGTRIAPFPAWRSMAAAPDLFKACDELAGMDDQDRARVYQMAARLVAERYPENKNVLATSVRAVLRGFEDMKHGMLQLGGNAVAAVLGNAGWMMGNQSDNWATRGEKALDRRLRIYEEIRRLALQEVRPLDLGKDASMAEQLLVDAASGVPMALLAHGKLPGFSILTLSGAGQAVADARQRAPEGSVNMQISAALLGSALQASIFVGMNRVGGKMMEQNIARFARAKGVKEYSLAGLKGLWGLGVENAKLLIAGKAGESASLGLQELAARLENKASHIDWREYGEDLTSLQSNLRQAAMNLPLILIGAGKTALRHYRSAEQVLGDGSCLLEWGISDRERQAIMAERHVGRQGEMLREALSGSRRWGGLGFLEEAWRSLRLLNDEHGEPFRDVSAVRDFLALPPAGERIARMEVQPRAEGQLPALPAPEPGAEQTRRTPQGQEKAGEHRSLAWRVWDEWYQKAYAPRPSGQELPPSIPEGNRLLERYREVSAQEWPAVVAEKKAAPPFAPYQEPARQEVLQECVDWAQRFSYRFLSQTHTVDALSRQRGSENDLRQQGEELRQRLMGELGKSVLRSVLGTPRPEAAGGMADFMQEYYQQLSSPGMQEPGASVSLRELAFQGGRGEAKELSPGLQEALDQVVGLGHCSEMLYRLLPQTEEFRSALGQGMTHLQAYAYMLEKHLGYDPALVKDYPQVPAPASAGPEHAAQEQEMFALYRKLTGRDWECSQGEDGADYWRIQLPDGRYTHWHRNRDLAVRELASRAALVFMPYAQGEPSYQKVQGAEETPVSTGFEQLNAAALQAMDAYWRGNAASAQFGMDLQRIRQKLMGIYRGDGVTPLIFETPQKGKQFAVDVFSVASPMGMLQAHFQVYWRRMISSGMVSAEEAGKYLLKQGYLTPKQVEKIEAIGRMEAPPTGLNLPRRMQRPPFGEYGMQMAMADQMGRFFADCCMSDIQRSPLPEAVKAWFALAPFYAPDEVTQTDFAKPPTVVQADQGRDLRRWSGHHAALKYQGYADYLAGLRERLPGKEDEFFHRHMKMALGDDPILCQEQSWCYEQAGRDALQSITPVQWNMVRSPRLAWERMPEEERQELREAIEEVCRQEAPPQYWEAEARGEAGDAVESAIQNLDEVLREYPELHRYSIDRENRVWRLTTEKGQPGVPFREPAPWPGKEPARMGGYVVERMEEMPAFMAEDARVLPALSLLDVMRSYASDAPYAAWGGIMWKGRVYGGPYGEKPPTIDHLWSTHEPMKGVLDLLGLYHALGKPLEACGTEVPGLSAQDLLHSPLDNITIYRDVEDPLRSYRLMPGNLEAFHPKGRQPYLIHSIAGGFLAGRHMADSLREFKDIYRPLRGFRRTKGYNLTPGYERTCAQVNVKDALMKAVRRGRRSFISSKTLETVEPMEELMMRLFEDTGFSLSLERTAPENLSPGQLLALRLARAMMLSSYGRDSALADKEMGDISRELCYDPSKRELLIDTLTHAREGYQGQMKQYEERREKEREEAEQRALEEKAAEEAGEGAAEEAAEGAGESGQGEDAGEKPESQSLPSGLSWREAARRAYKRRMEYAEYRRRGAKGKKAPDIQDKDTQDKDIQDQDAQDGNGEKGGMP